MGPELSASSSSSPPKVPFNPSPVPGEPALYEPATQTLVLTDLHFGHEVELLRGGVWVPSRARERTRRIVDLIERTGARRLVLNGDLKHLIPFSHRRERSELSNLFMTLRPLDIVVEVIPGNHDGNLAHQLPSRTVVHPPEGCIISPLEWSRKAIGRPSEDNVFSDDEYLKKNNSLDTSNTLDSSDSKMGKHLLDLIDSRAHVPGHRDVGLGLCHGHAWPSAEVMAQPVVAMGHNHPAILLPAGLPGENHLLQCWVRAPFNDTARKRYPEARGQLLIMPAFVEKAGRPVNRPWSRKGGTGTRGLGPLLANSFIDWDPAIVTTLDGVELGSVEALTQVLREAEAGEEASL